MRTRLLLPGAGIAVALSALAIWLARPVPSPAPAAGPPRVSFQPGARQAYRLHIESALRFARGATAGPRTIHQTVTGTLHLRVLDPGEDGARVALQLGGATVALNGQTSEELNRDIGRLFLARFAVDGAPTRFEFPAALGEQARTLL